MQRCGYDNVSLPRGVPNILSIPFILITVDETLTTPLGAARCRRAAPQITGSKMTITINQHLFQTDALQTDHYNGREGGLIAGLLYYTALMEPDRVYFHHY